MKKYMPHVLDVYCGECFFYCIFSTFCCFQLPSDHEEDILSDSDADVSSGSASDSD